MTFLELVRRLTIRRRDKFGKGSFGSERAERKLRVETLENRELLSATTGADGPYTVITYDEYLDNSISVVSAPAQSANRPAPSFADMMKAISAIEVQKNGSSQTALDPQFQPTVIAGNECCSLAQLEVLQAVYENYGLNDCDPASGVEQEFTSSGDGSEDSASGSEQEYMSLSGGSGGGGPTYWPFLISSQVGSSHVDSSISVSNAIQERYDSSSSSSSLAGDYVVVTAPALPASFYSTVTLEGTASYGSDYNIYVSTSASGIHGINVSNDTFVYSESGGSTQFYLVPLNDSLVEQDEVATLSFGAIQGPVSGGGDYYFDYLSTSGSATIVDDDHWEVSISAVDQDITPLTREYDEDGTLLPITLTEANEDGCFFRVIRSDDGTNRSGDLSYPISFTLDFEGQSNSNDVLWEFYNVEDESWRDSIDARGTIPTFFFSALLRLGAVHDRVVERYREISTISVQTAYGSDSSELNPFSVNPSYETISIVDADKLELHSLSFQDNLDLYSDTIESFGVNWKNTTHWYADNSSLTVPVAYACDDVLKCKASIWAATDNSLSFEVRAEWDNDSTEWITFDPFSTSPYVLATFTQNFISALGGRQALYEEHFKVTWKFRVVGEEERLCGSSDNPLYITYSRPTSTAQTYHTVVHTACKAYMDNIGSVLQSSTDESSNDPTPTVVTERNAFDAIWTAFTSLEIHKVNLVDGVVCYGEVLTYYGREPDSNATSASFQGVPYTYLENSPKASLAREYYFVTPSNPYSTACTDGLLYYLDGTCGGWQNFAINVFGSQGIVTSELSFDTIHNYNASSDDNHRYYFQVSSTAPGQGTGNSAEGPRENIWYDHAVFVYDEIVWDPSYGTNYGTSQNALNEFVGRLVGMGIVTSSVQTIDGYLRNYLYVSNVTKNVNLFN